MGFKAKKRPANLMDYARRVPLRVNAEDVWQLDQPSKICNWFKNKLKDEIDSRLVALRELSVDPTGNEEAIQVLLKTIYSNTGPRDLLPQLRIQFPFLNTVHSSLLKNIGMRAAKTIAKFQKSKKLLKKSAKNAGWLTYSSWKKDWTSLEYDEPKKGWDISQTGKLTITLGKDAEGKKRSLTLGLVKPPKNLAQARTCRIIREGKDRFFAVFTFRKEKPDTKPAARIVYMDPNHSNFLYGLDLAGNAFEVSNLKKLKSAEATLDKLTAKRDACEKKSLWVDCLRADGSVSTHWRPSRRWQRFDNAVKQLRERVREQKKHMMFSLANLLCRQYDVIGIGDYVPDNEDHGKGRRYNRAMVNRAFHGKFKSILSWVGLRSGKQVMIVNERRTTKTCHCCKHVVAEGIPPGVDQWQCPTCQVTHIRDENACQNGLQRMMQEIALSGVNCLHLPCSGPIAVSQRCDWHFQPQGWKEVSKDGASVNSTRRLNRQMSQMKLSVGVIASGQVVLDSTL